MNILRDLVSRVESIRRSEREQIDEPKFLDDSYTLLTQNQRAELDELSKAITDGEIEEYKPETADWADYSTGLTERGFDPVGCGSQRVVYRPPYETCEQMVVKFAAGMPHPESGIREPHRMLPNRTFIIDYMITSRPIVSTTLIPFTRRMGGISHPSG